MSNKDKGHFKDDRSMGLSGETGQISGFYDRVTKGVNQVAKSTGDSIKAVVGEKNYSTASETAAKVATSGKNVMVGVGSKLKAGAGSMRRAGRDIDYLRKHIDEALDICTEGELWGHKNKNCRIKDFSGDKLEGACMQKCDFHYSKMQGAILKEANLIEANLANVNMTECNLMDATLVNADLSGAILKNANLSYANLCYANLDDATLEGAIGVDKARFMRYPEDFKKSMPTRNENDNVSENKVESKKSQETRSATPVTSKISPSPDYNSNYNYNEPWYGPNSVRPYDDRQRKEKLAALRKQPRRVKLTEEKKKENNVKEGGLTQEQKDEVEIKLDDMRDLTDEDMKIHFDGLTKDEKRSDEHQHEHRELETYYHAYGWGKNKKEKDSFGNEKEVIHEPDMYGNTFNIQYYPPEYRRKGETESSETKKRAERADFAIISKPPSPNQFLQVVWLSFYYSYHFGELIRELGNLNLAEDIFRRLFEFEMTEENWREAVPLWIIMFDMWYYENEDIQHPLNIVAKHVLKKSLKGDISATLGMAKQLENIRGKPPEGLILELKKLTRHLRSQYVAALRDLNKEKANIEQLKTYILSSQQRVFALVLTIGIGLSNVISSYIYDRYVSDYV